MPRPSITDQKKPGTQKPGLSNELENIEKGISAIINKVHSGLRLSDLHLCVYEVLKAEKQENLKTLLLKQIDVRFQEWLGILKKETSLLPCFSSIFSDFVVYCDIFPKFYSEYDKKCRTSTMMNPTLFMIRERFLSIIISEKNLMLDIKNKLLDGIKCARNKNEADLPVLANVSKFFYSFKPDSQLYDDFKGQLLKATRRFYETVFSEHEITNFPAYVNSIIEILRHEESVSKMILDATDLKEILYSASSILIFDKEPLFFSGDEPPISHLLVYPDPRPIKWLVSWYSNFDVSTDCLTDVCCNYISNEILKFIPQFQKESEDSSKKESKAPKAPAKAPVRPVKKGPAKPEPKESEAKPENEEKKEEKPKGSTVPSIVVGVESIMKQVSILDKAYLTAFETVFGHKKKLDAAIFKAWNNEKFNIAESFALFIDHHIRNDFKDYNVEVFGPFPQLCAKFVHKIENKQPFVRYYEAFFINRLIKLGSHIEDIEKPVIEAITRTGVTDFMRNFDSFIKQIIESQRIAEDFVRDQSSRGEGKMPFQFSPIIFENSKFSLEKVEVKSIPRFLVEIHQGFSQKYLNDHPSHILTMLSDLSSVEIRVSIPPNKFSKQVRTYSVVSDILCASILSSIATSKQMSLLDLFEAVQEPRDRIKKYIIKLCSKGKQFLKRTKTIEVAEGQASSLDDSDVFSLNPNFFFEKLRVVIPPLENEHKKAKKEAEKNISMDTTSTIKAAIVRIMKSKNVITQVDLENNVSQTVSQYFRPDLSQIRSIITLLIDDQNDRYIERLENGDLKYIQ